MKWIRMEWYQNGWEAASNTRKIPIFVNATAPGPLVIGGSGRETGKRGGGGKAERNLSNPKEC